MPKVNVYLPDALAEAVKDTGVPVSAVCQHALELAVRRMTAIREIVSAGPDVDAAALPDSMLVSLTPRAHAVLTDAQQRAHAGGSAEIGTEHMLAGMIAEGRNLALRVLGTLDIEPSQMQRELARRARAGRPARSTAEGTAQSTAEGPAAEAALPPFGAQGAAALELAVSESTGLGNNYIGCEHLLLGLVAEPDGAAGQVLRGLGAELRITRRAVAAALAGYLHLSAQGNAAAAGDSAALAAALDRRLQPIVARLEQLEQRFGGAAQAG